jgi:RND family efflux transporter MFP subunit
MRQIFATIAVSLAAGLSACGTSERTVGAAPPPPVDVSVAPVRAIDTNERLEAGGVVEARESATISSRIVGTIVSLRVSTGDRVKAGDLLLTLDGRDTVEATNQARAGAVAADKAVALARTERGAVEAEHRLAAAWQKRIAALHARDSATDQERDEAEARLAAAAARAASAEAAIDAAQAQLESARAAVAVASATESFTTVRAPFDGLVTERLTDPGNLAAPGVPLLRIESDGARQIVVRVDEARAAYVHAGDGVTVLIDAPGETAGSQTAVEGTVSEVARAVGADQRAFTVKVAVPRTLTARSGSFARVVLRGAPRRALVIPPQAIRRHGQVSSVFVVQEGVARLRVIQAGPASSDGVEVLAGLDAGESVVLWPPAGLTDGTRVAVGGISTRTGGAP